MLFNQNFNLDNLDGFYGVKDGLIPFLLSSLTQKNNVFYIAKNDLELSKVNNFELYLIIFPWPETLIYGQKKFNWENFNSELCKKNNCKKLINLFGEFKRIKDKDKNWKHLIYIDDDVHLKKLGNSIIGNKIIEQF